MPAVPLPWVVSHVRDAFDIFEASDLPYPDLERACYRRLVADLRMKSVYENPYLNLRLGPAGWRAWFDLAKSILPSDLEVSRKKLKTHVELVHDLAYHLEEVARLKSELEELSAGEARQPAELNNPLALIDETVAQIKDCRNSHLPYLFASHIKPILDKLRGFRTGRYMPSVGQIISALSIKVSNYRDDLDTWGPSSADPMIAAALVSRQHAPLPEYVRCFDAAMAMQGKDVGGDDFLVPAEVMAVQAAVALNLHVVDVKQIRSARKVS